MDGRSSVNVHCGKEGDYRIISTSCDEIYEYVLLLVIKGNLRHRIEKLGTEKDEEELIMPQIKLRRIVEQQTQPWWIVENATSALNGRMELSSTCLRAMRV